MCGGSLTQVSPAQAANRSATWGNLARTQQSVIPMHRYQLRRRKRKINRVVGTGTTDKSQVTGFMTCYFQNCHHLAGGGKGGCVSCLCSSSSIAWRRELICSSREATASFKPSFSCCNNSILCCKCCKS